MITLLERKNEKNATKKCNRDTKFELLRIIAMILIILHHYSYHGGLLDSHVEGINKYIGIFIALGGKIGVNLFVLISGYFLIKSKFRIKKVFELILQVYFYSILLMIINLLLNNNVTKEMIINSLLPFVNLYWFFKVYILLYLFSPCINKIIRKLSKIEYASLIGVLFIIICVISPLLKIKFLGNIYFCFLLMYLIGGYIRVFDFKFQTIWDKQLINISMIIILFLINLQIYQLVPLQYFKYNLRISETFLPVVIISIITFVSFKQIKMKESKIINSIAGASFAAYLLHDNTYFMNIIWKLILRNDIFFYSNFVILIFHIIFSVFIIYFAGYVIEKIRLKLISFCRNLYYNQKYNYRALT